MAEQITSLLQVLNLAAGYGPKQVVGDISLQIDPGEIVAIIGHNGAGKSTIVKAIFGLVPLIAGRVLFDGRDQMGESEASRLRRGMVYVPQGQRVFAELTVKEHLALAKPFLQTSVVLRQRLAEVFDWLPALRPICRRRARVLSSGEKQTLALGMALMHRPRLLLLDEPSLGLAPPLIVQVMSRVSHFSRDFGTAVIIVEQKVREVLQLAQRVYVIRAGRVTFSGDAADLTQNPARLAEVFL